MGVFKQFFVLFYFPNNNDHNIQVALWSLMDFVGVKYSKQFFSQDIKIFLLLLKRMKQ